MNLHEHDEYFADKEIDLNLDAIYKKHVTHTHQRALEAVFLTGFHFIPKPNETWCGAEQEELKTLREAYTVLQQKYDALNSKFNINQPTVEPEQADAERAKLITQAMGMGTVFQTGEGYEQRS